MTSFAILVNRSEWNHMNDSKSSNEARAERILDAAARLITHYGYDKTTVSDIAREAGVSKGAIYLHWSSKEELFDALYEHAAQQYLDDWVALFEAESGDWSFVRMFQLMLELMQRHPFMMALHSYDQRVLGSMLRRDKSLLGQKGANNSELYHRLQEVGAARTDIEPRVIAFLLNAFSYGLLKAHEVIDADDIPSFEETVDGLGKILDRGLEPEGGGDRKAARELVQQMVRAVQEQQRAKTAHKETQV